MRIVFVSFIDSSNIGDLLIAEVLENNMMKGHKLAKYSFNLVPESNVKRTRIVLTKNKFKSIAKNLYNDYIRKLDFVDRLHLIRIKKRIDNNQYLADFEEDIKNCDLIVIGGGNAIFDLTKHSLSAYKFHKIFTIAQKYNKKTFVTSIGIGPFKTKKQHDFTVSTLKSADYITVRDKKSFGYIESLKEKAYLSIDPVFLLDKLTEDKSLDANKSKVISICVIDLLLNKDSMKKYKNYINSFVKFISLLNKEGYSIRLFSSEPRDYRAVNDVYNAIENKSDVHIVPVDDFNDLLNLYNETDLIIGTRMHSMIVGLSQLIPIVGLSWQDKVEQMFEMLDLQGDCFEIEDFEKEMNSIVELVNEKLTSTDTRESLQNLKEENLQKFAVNTQLFMQIVEEIEGAKGPNE